MHSVPDLHFFNLSTGIDTIRRKLPDFINNGWRNHSSRYEARYGYYPDFQNFCDFLEEKADLLCSDTLLSKHAADTHAPKHVVDKQKTKPMKTLQTDLKDGSLENDLSLVKRSPR